MDGDRHFSNEVQEHFCPADGRRFTLGLLAALCCKASAFEIDPSFVFQQPPFDAQQPLIWQGCCCFIKDEGKAWIGSQMRKGDSGHFSLFE